MVTPVFEAPTKKMRAVLPKEIPLTKHVTNGQAAAELLLGIVQGDPLALGRGLGADGIVEPARAPLIPGFSAVKRAAGEAGAAGCTISGAGPTCVAVVGSEAEGAAVVAAMTDAFVNEGGLEIEYAGVQRLCTEGAKAI